MTDKTNEYNTICQRLDDIIIEYTSLLESYSDSMNHLQSKIKNVKFYFTHKFHLSLSIRI